MIWIFGAMLRQAYERCKRLPPPPPEPPRNQLCVSTEEAHALEQVLKFLSEEEGKSHQGYYSTGWAGRTLWAFLRRYKMQVNRRWYIRHKITGLYLGSCHTTGDGIWTDKKYAEWWSTRELAMHDGMNYHPFLRLKDEVVNIVEEPVDA